MKIHSILLFPALFSVCFSQQLFSFNTIKGGGVKTPLPLPTPFGVYVSAKSDPDNLLAQIFVVTGDNYQFSLYQLKNSKIMGELTPLHITDSAYLTTTLTADQLKTLNGVMFLSSPNQHNDNNFYVYDVSNSQYIYRTFNSTILFLNTCMDTIPKRSSNIQRWSQNAVTHAHIYAGFPLDSIEPINTQIFSNPTHDVYFQNVEFFSISLTAFYLKTYNGAVNFDIQPDYDDMYRIPITTSAYTTTGFYMKPMGQDDRNITINTKRDTHYLGSTGANIIGHLPNGQKVTVGEYDGPSHSEFSVTPSDFIAPWSTPNIGQKIQISSTSGKNGYYYVQYFVIQGGRKFSTTTPNVETTKSKFNTTMETTTISKENVETTTSSTENLQSVITLMISTVIVGFL